MEDRPELTFEEARQIVADHYGGGQATADYGLVGEGFALVIVGPKEWIVDRNPDYAPLDNSAHLVNLITGDLTITTASSIFDLTDEMDEVGSWPE